MENQRKNDDEEEEMNEGTTKMILHVMIKMILGMITLKHNLGLSILYFETVNHGYITYLESPFWSNVDT